MSKFEILPKLPQIATKDIMPMWVYTISAKRMMSYRKQYIPFRATLQLLKKIEPMPCFPSDSHEAYHGYHDIRLFSWISGKDHQF